MNEKPENEQPEQDAPKMQAESKDDLPPPASEDAAPDRGNWVIKGNNTQEKE